MKIGIHSYYNIFNQNNSIFDSGLYPIGDSLEYPLIKLKEKIKSLGYNICTLDQYPLKSFNKIIFLDLPNNINLKALRDLGIDLYLVILESPIIRPNNWIIENHKYFKKVFHWRDDFITNNKYIPLKLASKIDHTTYFNIIEKEKLCTLIVGNKKSSLPGELYSERVKSINWFEKNHPLDFDLYGVGWEKYHFTGFFRFFNRINILGKILSSNYSTYKGIVEKKRYVLSKYKFSICYENVQGIPGYITEKIFDSLCAGCVPIYLGAPNIAKYIPKDCFIDMRNFSSYEDLYFYIKNIGDFEYNTFINNIRDFLVGKAVYPFTWEAFVETISREIFTCC